METGKRQDRRVQRTKKSIRNAFLRLLAEKPLDKMSVKEIADYADIDRKTVYNYYNGVYDILDDLETELMQDFEVAIEGFDFETREDLDIFLELAQILKKRMDIYSLLMKIDNARLQPKLVISLKEKVVKVINRFGAYPENQVALVAEYITSGLYVAYRHWFNSDRQQPIEEFTVDVFRLMLGGAASYLDALL